MVGENISDEDGESDNKNLHEDEASELYEEGFIVESEVSEDDSEEINSQIDGIVESMEQREERKRIRAEERRT